MMPNRVDGRKWGEGERKRGGRRAREDFPSGTGLTLTAVYCTQSSPGYFGDDNSDVPLEPAGHGDI